MSTPSTDEYLEDQLALSRLDDDGAPPGPQARALARTPDRASPDGARLSLVPAPAGQGGLGGGGGPGPGTPRLSSPD